MRWTAKKKVSTSWEKNSKNSLQWLKHNFMGAIVEYGDGEECFFLKNVLLNNVWSVHTCLYDTYQLHGSIQKNVIFPVDKLDDVS